MTICPARDPWKLAWPNEFYQVQYIPRNMHTVFALLCFVVVIHWLIFPYPSGLLHWHCGNLTIAPVPAKQPWWILINTSSEFMMNDCITTTKQSTTKPCAYFLGYTVLPCSVDFKAPAELWNPMSMTVLSKCSFIWIKGPVNIWNDQKVKNQLVLQTCKYFS